jgi:hypothetical protein
MVLTQPELKPKTLCWVPSEMEEKKRKINSTKVCGQFGILMGVYIIVHN